MKFPISLFAALSLAFAIIGTAPVLSETITLMPVTPSPTIVNAKACGHPFQDATLSFTAYENPAGNENSEIPGLSVLKIDLNAQGVLTSEKVNTTSGNPWLDQAAMRSAEESTYTPQVNNCQPVASSYLYEVEY